MGTERVRWEAGRTAAPVSRRVHGTSVQPRLELKGESEGRPSGPPAPPPAEPHLKGQEAQSQSQEVHSQTRWRDRK